MGGSLSKRSITAIKWLLTDNKISSRVFEDADNKEKYKICTVRNDGKIILGKTPYYWWNQLIKCQDTITFQDFAFRCWDALVDMAGPNSTVVYEGLRNEIAEKAIRKDQYDWVVDRLFDVARHVCTEGSLSTVTDLRGDLRETKEPNVNKAYSGNTNKVININVNGERKSIPITDSVGDPLIDIIVGPIGFKVRNGKLSIIIIFARISLWNLWVILTLYTIFIKSIIYLEGILNRLKNNIHIQYKFIPTEICGFPRGDGLRLVPPEIYLYFLLYLE